MKSNRPFDPVRAYFQASFPRAVLNILLVPVAFLVVGRLAFGSFAVPAAAAAVMSAFVLIRSRSALAYHLAVTKELHSGHTGRITLSPSRLEADRERTPSRRSPRSGQTWNVGCIKYALIGDSGEFRLSACSDFAAPPSDLVPEGVKFEVEYLENTRVVTAITPLPAENDEQKEWLDKFRECFKQYFE